MRRLSRNGAWERRPWKTHGEFRSDERMSIMKKTTISLLVIFSLFPVWSAAEAPPLEDPFLDQLAGKWIMEGSLLGNPVDSSLEVGWVLEHRFLQLEMRDLGEPSQYEAKILIGFDGKKKRYVAHWLDRFGGGPSSTLGFGQRHGQSLELLFDYPSGSFRDIFTFDVDSGQWDLVIDSRQADGTFVQFAAYQMTRKAQAGPVRDLLLLYTNDLESAYDPIDAFWRDDIDHIGGVGQLAALITSERSKASTSFLLDAGDIFTGSLSKMSRGRLPFELMISMDYDVMCIGNHEFEYGWRALRKVMQLAPFPVLAANIFYEGTDIPFAQPSTILERDGVQIGVIGIFGTDAATALFPPHLAGLEVRDPVEAARKAVAELRPDVDLIILLTHEGKTAPMQTDDEADPSVQRDIDADIRLVGAVEGVDILIGGHADAGQETPYVHPETGTLICQTYGQGTRLGYLRLRIDLEKNSIISHEGKLIVVDADKLEADPAITAKLDAARKRFPELGRIAGSVSEALLRRYNRESDIGNLFADVLREYGSTELAFVHSGCIRADLPAGRLSREQLLNTFPFMDRVLLISMTGAEILDVLEQGFSLRRGVLQVSGLEAEYDLSQPVGGRVRKVRIGGHPLDPAARYSVTTLDFLVSGADLFSGFTEAEITNDEGPDFASLLEEYFSRKKEVGVPVRGRLIPVGD